MAGEEATKKQEVDLSKLKVDDLLAEIHGRGYLASKMRATSGETFRVPSALTRFRGKSIRFGVVSDTHLCSRYQQLTHLNTFYRLCQRRRIGLVLHAGDIVAGQKIYRGQEFDIFMHGYNAQRKYAVEHYPRYKGVQTKWIGGNHDYAFYKGAGAYIAQDIASARPDIDYLGETLAYLELGSIKVMLLHGTAGTAYAVSYKSQKIVEKLPGGQKPHFLFLGHFHNPNHIPMYRNVETIQMSCFEGQTPYLMARGLQPVIAGLIVTVTPDEEGIGKVVYEWIPFYDHIEDDY